MRRLLGKGKLLCAIAESAGVYGGTRGGGGEERETESEIDIERER